MIVQSIDGKYYDEPIFVGEGWYIHFLDGGGEIVCRPRVSVRRSLDASGVPATLGHRVEVQTRVFPGTDFLQRACAWKLTVTGPVPTPRFFKHELHDAYGGDILEWNKYVDGDQIVAILDGKPGGYPLALLTYLVGEAALDVPTKLKKAQREIRKQLGIPSDTHGDGLRYLLYEKHVLRRKMARHREAV